MFYNTLNVIIIARPYPRLVDNYDFMYRTMKKYEEHKAKTYAHHHRAQARAPGGGGVRMFFL